MRPETQHLWRGFGEAWTAVSYLLSGIVVWGGAGFLLDRWLSTRPALFVVGVLIGNVGGAYLMYRRVSQAAVGPAKGERRHAA